MTGFIQLLTIDNNRIYIDPDTIVSFSEFRFRENDIGLVGTSIVYCIGSVPTSIYVRDPIDYVADQIMVGYDNCPDGLPLCKHKDDDLLPQLQGKTIQINESPDLTDLETLQSLYDRAASPKVKQTIQNIAQLLPPVQKPYTGPSIENFIDFIENHPANLQVQPTPQETPPCNGNGEAQSTEE